MSSLRCLLGFAVEKYINEGFSAQSYEAVWKYVPHSSQKTKVRNFPKFSSFGELLWIIFGWEQVSELGHQFYGFLGERSKRHNFEKFLRISPAFFHKNIPENFSENSWEILRSWLRENYQNPLWEIPRNGLREIPQNWFWYIPVK